MRAITLHEPWATMIADGTKTYETRHWAPPSTLYGRRIAIHAGRTVDVDAVDLFDYDLGAMYENAGKFACTAVLSHAFRVKSYKLLVRRHRRHYVVTTGEVRGGVEVPPTMTADRYGDWSKGRWIWALIDVRALDERIPCHGQQGFWNVPEDIEGRLP
ncbi:MAG: ASCH domain-containing protein [Rhodospirillales bacterium]|nr:ASCH domain-containing protein [Rhodospirillales bacterium]